MTARPRSIISTLLLLVVVPFVPLTALLPAAASVAASVPVELDCADLLNDEQTAFVQSQGLVLDASQLAGATVIQDPQIINRDGALNCWWGNALYLGVIPVPDEEAPSVIALLGIRNDDGDDVYQDGTSSYAQENTFADDRWYSTYRFGRENTVGVSALALRDRVRELTAAVDVPVVPVVPGDEASETQPFVGVSQLETGEADAPSTLSGLRAPRDLALSPTQLAVAGGAALVLVAIVALPGKLMESAITGNRERIGAWLTRRMPMLGRLRIAQPTGRRARIALIAAVVVVGALLSTLVDPEAGANPGTVRMIGSLLLAITIESVVGVAVVGALARRGPGGWTMWARPGSLLAILIAALLSRLSGFEPGFLFGVVVALILGSSADERDSRRVTYLELGWLAVLGAISWFAYGLAVAADVGGPAGTLVVETLSALAIGTFTALPLLLLPWRGLAGGELYSRSRVGWIVAYVAAALAFLIVVLPLPDSWDTVSAPFVVWIGAFLIYAVIAVIIWAVATFGPWTRYPASDPVESARR